MSVYVDIEGRKAMGVPMTRAHAKKLENEGKMPRSFLVNGKSAHLRDELEVFKRVRLVMRDHPSIRKKLAKFIADKMADEGNPWADNGKQIDEQVAILLKQGERK